MIDVHVEQTLAGKRRVFSWSACPVTDNGQVLGTVGSLLDITDRVQAVTALRQARAPAGQARQAVAMRRAAI